MADQVPFPRWAEIAQAGELYDRFVAAGMNPETARPLADGLAEVFRIKAREEETNYEALVEQL